MHAESLYRRSQMSVLKELVTVATKVAADGAMKGKGIIKDAITSVAAVAAGTAAEEAAKKTGILRTNRYGELVLKVPFFKTTEDKIVKAFSEHPDRKKVCFHFTESIRDGVAFYDPEGNEAFSIRGSKKNLKQIELYEGSRFVGRIEKHVTINLNPFADVQKYDALARGSSGIIKVEWFNASADFASWVLKHKRGGNYIIEGNNGEEIGRVYSLGFFNFVMDYETTVDPVGLILAFMAIKIRAEEVKRNHQHGHKGSLWIEDVIADIKDVF